MTLRRGWFLIVAAFGVAITGCWVDRSSKTESEPTVCPAPSATETLAAAVVAARQQELEKFHEKCVNIFVTQDGFGISRLGPLHTPGPFPSTLTLPLLARSLHEETPPTAAGTLPAAGESAETRATYLVEKLELIGAVYHKPPQAYEMGKKGERRPGPRKLRATNEFETEALKLLEMGKEVQISERADQITMVGAIRAGAKCVNCHRNEKQPVKEGTLLGALTYTLKPAPQ
jgi:hypothetical protein